LEADFILFCAGAVIYLSSVIAFIAAFIFSNDNINKAGVCLSVAAIALNGLSLIARWVASGHPPLTGIYETLSLFSFFIGLVFIFIIMKRWVKAGVLGVSVLPLIMVFVLVALINYSAAGTLAVSLRSIWLFIHVPIAIFSYALFGVAAVCGVLYLLNIRKQGEESKDLRVIDKVVYRSVAGGFIMLTIAIVTGAVWAESAWGSYWSWDPKETWSLITWFVYAIFLHTRLVKGWKGRKAAIIAIIGFVAVIFTYFGVNLIGGLHSY
jgi:cytochrome c-type biogenesis protein CcsB